jgi:hypothetical protein
MPENTETPLACPLLTIAGAMLKSQFPTIKMDGFCLKGKCAWWYHEMYMDRDYSRCAMTKIASEMRNP